MEYVPGRTLDAVIGRTGLRTRDALRHARQMADALAAAHAAGILHRDLKPANVMVNEAGLVIVGTIAYMSPEQAEGKKLDFRSDIVSFGAVFYEMLTGRRPFAGNSQAATLAAILQNDPKPASAVREDLPPEIEKLVARCRSRIWRKIRRVPANR
jgi:serine/threonine protein kinase